MTKGDLIEALIEYGEDRDELKRMTKEELKEQLEEYEDTSDMFPNGDQYDGSHEYD